MYDTTGTSDFIMQWLENPGVSIVAILIFGWVAHHFGSTIIDQLIRRVVRNSYFHDLSDDDVRKRQDTLIGLFTAIWKTIVVIVVSILIFQRLFPQVNLTPIFASAGIVGIALGFGAQSLIKDFLSGAFIILENQYRIGDVVDIEGAAGTVEKITMRTTVLRDADGNVHYLPNGNVMHVINKTMGYSKVNFSLVVDPSTNIDELAELINKVGERLAKDEKWQGKILTPPRFLSIGTFSDVALEVNISGKTQPSAQWSVTGEMRRRLLASLKKNNIELASLPVGISAAAPRKN